MGKFGKEVAQSEWLSPGSGDACELASAKFSPHPPGRGLRASGDRACNPPYKQARGNDSGAQMIHGAQRFRELAKFAIINGAFSNYAFETDFRLNRIGGWNIYSNHQFPCVRLSVE